MSRAVYRVVAVMFGAVTCVLAWDLVNKTVVSGVWVIPKMADELVGLVVAGGLAWGMWRSAGS